MVMPFLDREEEQRRLRKLLRRDGGGLGVLYGRRRSGKSRLIQEVAEPGDVYFLADQRDVPLQIDAFAVEIGRLVPHFAAARYASWDGLLGALRARMSDRLNILVDELPYLAVASPELPSVIQRHLDLPGRMKINFLLCGSSQRMMQGLALDRTAPLYGRAHEILKLEPLRPGWITAALGLGGEDAAAAAVESYSIWGGIPRYWELARGHRSRAEALRELVLDRKGVLHEEPARLLLDDMRTAGLPYSLLTLVGSGCNRLSEIAGRLGKPAGSLTRPLSNLIELGYVRKDVPFGEDARSSKRTLYKITDPFLLFFFRFLPPSQSLLEMGVMKPVERRIQEGFASHVAEVWEDLARQSVPFLDLGSHQWGAAGRWWGVGMDGAQIELDVVAQSLDRKHVLVGEAKWSGGEVKVDRLVHQLRARAAQAPFVRGRKVTFCVWLKRPVRIHDDVQVITPDRVLRALR